MMEVRDWLLTISMIGHFAYTVWAYVERRGDKTAEKLQAMQTRLDSVDRDLAGLHQAVASAPNHKDLGEIYNAIKDQARTTSEQINDLASQVHQLVGENRGQSDLLRQLVAQQFRGSAHHD
ncbi:MAG: hypothetical protein ACRCTU_08575 [Zoogloea sp.]|uniref:hypothetical protein n=1 Tax=Zoogloea sp. TaxID=49181 RepID=UPI003F32007C